MYIVLVTIIGFRYVINTENAYVLLRFFSLTLHSLLKQLQESIPDQRKLDQSYEGFRSISSPFNI